jgi:xanthine dehydrogenase molybdopterin-binding subunit B
MVVLKVSAAGLALVPVKFGISFTATFFNQARPAASCRANGRSQLTLPTDVPN